MHIIAENVLMLLTQNYPNQSMLDETTACQTFARFLRHSVSLCENIKLLHNNNNNNGFV